MLCYLLIESVVLVPELVDQLHFGDELLVFVGVGGAQGVVFFFDCFELGHEIGDVSGDLFAPFF